ncbi:MAG: RiPP maturation radical SAM C-methyltransferase [Pseudomonadota bacterium]
MSIGKPGAPRVALLNMPFSTSRRPSIQTGLLQAIIEKNGYYVKTHYLNLKFGARIGWDLNEKICQGFYRHLLGEWIFSYAAFGNESIESSRYLGAYANHLTGYCETLGCNTEFLTELRMRVAPAFIQECLETVAWEDYDVIGFSSVFQQNCAALALAHLLKNHFPQIFIVFGGANFEDEMALEYVQTLAWIDYAIIGEGDEAFPMLLERLTAGDLKPDMPGIAYRKGEEIFYRGRSPMVKDLNALPEPNYDDFFATALAVELPGTVVGCEVALLFESSRGCWWGAKHHCTFCGLNGLCMTFRPKSPERVLAGIDELSRRYGENSFAAVDNILDNRYIRAVFDPLSKQKTDYTFFYEVKANLTPTQLRRMAQGGVRFIQPGIESLSTHTLKLMQKGTTGIQNVLLLKWAVYYGMSVNWNILYGVPGENPEDFETQYETMKLIPHLPPPRGLIHIWLERFSPNYIKAEEMGFQNIRPFGSYACIYPEYISPHKIAYFFDYDLTKNYSDEALKPMSDYIRWWRGAWDNQKKPYLVYLRGADRMTVIDGRRPDMPKSYIFHEPAVLIYEYCNLKYKSARLISKHLRSRFGLDTDECNVQSDLDKFIMLGLIMKEDSNYLSLALPANPHW